MKKIFSNPIFLSVILSLFLIQCLSSIEYVNASPNGFDNTDTNGDGQITLTELDSHIILIFAKGDKNQDGYLDINEIGTSTSGYDANGDKKITVKELMEEAHRRFKAADLDNDKVLVAQEVVKFSGN
jgi:Ca2+-binding EF-hand superfamily protein